MLERLTERIWFLPGEEETDRPYLYYVNGDEKSLAIDAGNSPAHVEKFYRALEAEDLRKPEITVLTHWHWDHTFGMRAVVGKTAASTRTNEKLRQVRNWEWTRESMDLREETGEDISFCNECIRKEYGNLEEIQVVPADLEVGDRLDIALGGVTCRLLHRDSPHSRDALFAYFPEVKTLAVGDAVCGDLYENGGNSDPEKLKALIGFLEFTDFEHCLLGHDRPCGKAELLKALREDLDEC